MPKLVQWLLAFALVVNILLIGVSWIRALIGRETPLLKMSTFLVGAAILALLARPVRASGFGKGSVSPRAQEWARSILKPLLTWTIAAGFLSLGLYALGSRGQGVAQEPAFQRLPSYELQNHGKLIAVPRWRYALASGSFATGWHALSAILSLGALSFLLCGEWVLNSTKEEADKSVER